MSDELQDYDEELESLCNDIRTGIEKLNNRKSKFTPQDRANKIQYLNSRATRAKQVLKSFKVELRELPKTEAEPYQKKLKDYTDEVNKFIQDLNWAADKNELMDGNQPTTAQQMDTMTTQQLVEKGAKTQQKSLDSLSSTLLIIEETKDVGAAAAEKLKAQTDQLVRVGEQLDEMQSYLKQASKELRSFARRLATDKIIMGFMCIIVCGVVVIVVLSVLKKTNGSGSGLDSFT